MSLGVKRGKQVYLSLLIKGRIQRKDLKVKGSKRTNGEEG